MKQLLGTIAFVLFISTFATGQTKFLLLNEALKSPEEIGEIKFSASEKSKTLSKFYRKKEKFDDLYTIYIEQGFETAVLEKLINELNELTLLEVVWECDTLEGNIELLSKFRGIDNITLKNIENLSPKDRLALNKLKIQSLTISHTDASINFSELVLPQNLNSLTIKSDIITNYDELVEAITPISSLNSITLSVKQMNNLPSALTTLPNLTEIGVLKSDEINYAEENFYEEAYWVSVFKGSITQILQINYKGLTPLTDNEKQLLLSSFPNSSFISTAVANASKPKKRATEIIRKQNQNAFTTQSEVTPLIKNLEKKRIISSIYANESTGVTYPSGTVIHIPTNAFVDEEGKLVEGKVDVSYREMKTPAEIILAGIPMAYDSGGVVNQFQSAGNFEILAAQNGKPLKLANGKKITVDFVSADQEGGYNFYKYDAQTKNWDYKDKANKPVDSKFNYGNEKQKWISNKITIDSTIIVFPFDCTPFDERFYSKNHIFLADSNKTSKWYNRKRGFEGQVRNKGERKPFKYLGATKIHKKKRLVKLNVKKVKNASRDSLYQVVFTLSQRKLKKRDYMFFPELRAFRGKKFYTYDVTRNRDFKKEFTRKKRYNDLRIEYTKGDDFCLIHFKDKDGIKTIEVDITDGHKGRNIRLKKWSFNLRYKRYLKFLREKEDFFNNSIEQKRRRVINDIFNKKKAIRDSINKANGIMDNEFSNNVTRSLSIAGLGIYNCDQIRRLAMPRAIIRNFLVKSDSTIFSPYVVYIIDKKINGVLTYSYGQNAVLNKKNTRAVVAIDTNGNIFYTKNIDDQSIKEKVLALDLLPTDEIKTASQFNALLGL